MKRSSAVRIGADQWVATGRPTLPSRLGRSPREAHLEREGDGRAHGPQAHTEERDVDRNGLPRPLPVEQRPHDPSGDGHAADRIAVAGTGLADQTFGIRRRAAHGTGGTAPVAQEVVAALVGLGTTLTAARPGHVDDVRVVGPDVVDLDVELLAHGGELVGQEDVAGGGSL